ncbi:MAG TPA: hypothetical protein PLC58_09095 [Denitromonas sp.]|nr:hypothetical protein [Denitromonas sp.]
MATADTASTPLLPEPWHTHLQSALAPDESIEAWLTLDLDDTLRFSDSVLVLTSRQLIACATDGQIAAWPLDAAFELHAHDHAGVGSLTLQNETARQAIWRFTLTQNPAALRFCRRFDQILDALREGREAGPVPAVPWLR